MSNQLEERVSAIERELLELRKNLDLAKAGKPWWEQIAGTFEGDEVYREAMKLGSDYRRTTSVNLSESE
jgi:hypothetical protein